MAVSMVALPVGSLTSARAHPSVSVPSSSRFTRAPLGGYRSRHDDDLWWATATGSGSKAFFPESDIDRDGGSGHDWALRWSPKGSMVLSTDKWWSAVSTGEHLFSYHAVNDDMRIQQRWGEFLVLRVRVDFCFFCLILIWSKRKLNPLLLAVGTRLDLGADSWGPDRH
jgi:hypothetical protein